MSQSKPRLTPKTNVDALEPDRRVDATGLYCPEPVMLLHKNFRELAIGEVLELSATDPSTTRDVPKFCAFLGHELVASEQRDDVFVYLLKKCEE